MGKNIIMNLYDKKKKKNDKSMINKIILFHRALNGCGTTSALFQKGKKKCVQILRLNRGHKLDHFDL